MKHIVKHVNAPRQFGESEIASMFHSQDTHIREGCQIQSSRRPESPPKSPRQGDSILLQVVCRSRGEESAREDSKSCFSRVNIEARSLICQYVSGDKKRWLRGKEHPSPVDQRYASPTPRSEISHPSLR